MKVKKFIAPSMPEAMKKIREELGKDAVILNSKVVQKGGFLGLFTKKNIEVIAAIDPQPISTKNQVKKKLQPKKEQERISPITPVKYEEKSRDDRVLINEIKDLKEVLKDFAHKDHTKIGNYPEEINKLNDFLIDQEINDEMRKQILPNLLEKWFLNKTSASEKDRLLWLKEELLKKISHLDFGGIHFQKKFVNVVGPTGVGKTTSLAKIAAHSVLKHKKKVAFITTDTYRIAAIEQLKTYAQILNVPVEVAYDLDDFKKAIEKFSEYDLVLIDTAGRNFRNKKYVEDFKNLIGISEDMEIYLVLSLTSKYRDMDSIVKQFSLVNINKFIFTKVDETAQYGAIVNLMTKYQIGTAYLTNGQNVPDDIVEATPEIIINTLIGDRGL